MNVRNIQDPDTEEALRAMLAEATRIADDWARCFDYHQSRKPLLNTLLGDSSQN